MKKQQKTNGLAVAGTFVLGILSINAGASQGWYLGAEGGVNWLSTEDFVQQGQPAFNAHYYDGYVFGLNGGYAYPNGLRPEFAFDYRHNGFSRVSGSGFSVLAAGHEEAYTMMGNLWYDFKLPQGWAPALRPYAGVGLGVARVGVSGLTTYTQPPMSLISGYNTNLAYQFGAGVGYEVMPHVTVSADYRFLQAVPGEYNPANGSGAGPFTTHFRTQSLMLGIRYGFGEPPAPAPVLVQAAPPPMPAPMPEPAAQSRCANAPAGFKVDANGCIVPQTLIIESVNFLTNSDQLTDTATKRLDDVAAGLVGQPGIRLEIGGHTDSRASKAYNLKLSARRAASVRAYLVSKGVAADSLTSRGYGDTLPIASNKTAEGRAKNRRVEFKVLGQLPEGLRVESK